MQYGGTCATRASYICVCMYMCHALGARPAAAQSLTGQNSVIEKFAREVPTSNVAGGERVDYSLPQVLLAGLGAAKTLQQLIELHHATRGQVKGSARAAHNSHELFVFRLRDVMHALVCALDEPGKREISQLVYMIETDFIKATCY